MKQKSVKKLSNKKTIVQPKCRLWIWVVCAFLLGGAIGYITHYTIINWHGFFATCPNGISPDKNGCCGDEIYTDAGDGWMVCCPPEGDNCFPPIK